MTKRVEHRLVFSKTTDPSQGEVYKCSALLGSSDYSKSLASLLSVLSDKYTDDFFTEVNNAIQGKDYEEYFDFDFETDSLAIQPSYIVYEDSSAQEVKVPITEFVTLLEEWISFLKSGKAR